MDTKSAGRQFARLHTSLMHESSSAETSLRAAAVDCLYYRSTGLESVRYGVSNVLDTAYWGFLRVGTTFDIFQNIHILYLQYGVLVFSGYGVLIMFPSWSLVSAGTDTPYLP
ncbi:hypothetical protein Tco_0323940 [Tanacetum coccineum]